jgi:hypothetical protein
MQSAMHNMRLTQTSVIDRAEPRMPRVGPNLIRFLRHTARASQMALWMLVACPSLFAQAGSTGSTTAQPGWLLNQTSLIAPGDLPGPLATALQQSGARMMSASTAQIALSGSITDTQGTRSAQITIQAPGYMIYRDGNGNGVAFNGTSLVTNSGALSTSDEAIAESLLAQFPDMVCLQVDTGGSFRRIGSHFRTSAATGGSYTGPYWTVLAFAPAARTGLTAGAALQQTLFIAVDESTGFISEVRTTVTTGQQKHIIETEFQNWTNQSGQWYPGSIVRFQDGQQILNFQAQSITVGPAGPNTTFVP